MYVVIYIYIYNIYIHNRENNVPIITCITVINELPGYICMYV